MMYEFKTQYDGNKVDFSYNGWRWIPSEDKIAVYDSYYDTTFKTVTFNDLKQVFESKVTNCKNCAAPLNWAKTSCEYCGTFFRRN
jgi:hypothetical protein